MGPLGTPLGNPLGYFNSLKGKNKVEPKQTLRKAQDGLTAGPFDENTSKYLDARYPGTALKFQGPVDPNYEADQRDNVAQPRSTGWNRISDLEKWDREREEKIMRSKGWNEDFNAGPMKTKEDVENAPYDYKKGGATKALPKAQLGGILKLAIRATKPLAKTLKPVAKKIVSKSKTTATKKFNYPKDKVKSMFPRVAEDVKKYNSVTDSKKLFERKTIKEQMKQWDKAAELKQQKKYPVLKNKN
jgi:hypothetical protein